MKMIQRINTYPIYAFTIDFQSESFDSCFHFSECWSDSGNWSNNGNFKNDPWSYCWSGSIVWSRNARNDRSGV